MKRVGKGRGGKPRRVMERSFRTAAGPKVTIEHRRGLDDDVMLAAFQEVVDQLRGRRAEGSEAA